MATKIHTHYDNLKVARNAPPEIIRAAYKTLSKKYHPDHNPGSPEAMRIIQLINSAYDVLSDPVRRQEHDQWIAQEERQQDKPPQQVKTSAASSRSHHASPARSRGAHSRDPLRRLATFFEQLLRSFYRRT